MMLVWCLIASGATIEKVQELQLPPNFVLTIGIETIVHYDHLEKK